jgi:hypothetical protein
MTPQELKRFSGCVSTLKAVSKGNEEILNILGMTEDEKRFYVVTEARKADSRITLEEAVLRQGKFSEKNAANVV